VADYSSALAIVRLRKSFFVPEEGMARRALSLLFVLLLPIPAFAQKAPAAKEAAVPAIHIVLFTPAGIEPPADSRKKIGAAAAYAETFFAKWMKRWGYPPAREKIFAREKDGTVRVLHVRSSKPAGDYLTIAHLDLLREVWPLAHKTYDLPQDHPVWWVWVYLGDPPTRFKDYRGWGEMRGGGWAVVNYENRPGTINPRMELGAGFHEEFTLKGCIHELGHALGLPHIGPRLKDRLGNSLMGPNMSVYNPALGVKEGRVYLSQAAAAILWKHFVFSGTAENRNVMPSVSVQDFRTRYDRAKGEIEVTGKLESDGKAHSMVLTDDAIPNQKDYWRKAYAARIGADGRFTIRVREPSRANGTFHLLFCFDNGAVTGDGKHAELEHAFAKKYEFAGGDYRLEL
jgi:hypothetical protein